MSVKLGLDGKLYRNTGSYAVPVWDEITIVRDLTLTLESAEADASSRGSGGWRETLAALKDGSLEFELVYDPASTDYVAVRDAWINRTVTEFAVADGAIATSGTQYLRAHMNIFSLTREEPLEEAMIVSAMAKPAPNANAPPVFVTTP